MDFLGAGISLPETTDPLLAEKLSKNDKIKGNQLQELEEKFKQQKHAESDEEKGKRDFFICICTLE